MELVLIVFGIGCLVGAIVGGGVRVRQQDSELQVPLVASRSRQALLALLGVGVLKESINILMEQVRGLQFDRLSLTHSAKGKPKPLWFSIDSTEGEASPGDGQLAPAISTHLKKLSAAEIALLGRHGGSLVEHRLKRYAPELLNR